MGIERRPPITAVDTSVIVPSLTFWHERHEIAAAELSALLEGQAKIVLPLHVVVEAYAVLTRLPPPHRLSPAAARETLEGSFRARSTLVGLEGDEPWDLIGDLSRRSVAGGTTYDGLILTCARKGGARRLLTFNRAHFERVGSEGIEIRVPGSTTIDLRP